MANFKTYTGPNGEKLARVTQITGQLDKPALMYWAVNCYHDYLTEVLDNRENDGKSNPDYVGTKLMRGMIDAGKTNFRTVSDKAKDIGSLVHDLIHKYLLTGTEPGQDVGNEALSSFIAFLEFSKLHNMEMHKAEIVLLGDGYGGTVDFIGMLDGKRTVIDWKSSKGIYPEMKYQVAAYRRAFDMDKVRVKAFGGRLEASGILRLDKLTGMPEYVDISDTFVDDEQAFLYLRDFYLLTKKSKK